jgi:hypothetical protein
MTMRGIPRRVSAFLALAVLLSAGMARLAAATELVVVEAHGVALTPGGTVDGTKPLKLDLGQQITLISPAGDTIKIDGPYNQAPEAAASAPDGAGVVSSLKTLVATRDASTTTFGVVRGTTAAGPTDPWFIDATATGDRCVRGKDKVMLWRGQTAKASQLQITPGDHSWRANTTWPSGADSIGIDRLPMSDGQIYLIDLDGKQAVLTFHFVPDRLTTNAMRAAWMAYIGCSGQAAQLALQLSVAGGQSGPGASGQ